MSDEMTPPAGELLRTRFKALQKKSMVAIMLALRARNKHDEDSKLTGRGTQESKRRTKTTVKGSLRRSSKTARDDKDHAPQSESTLGSHVERGGRRASGDGQGKDEHNVQ